MRILKLLDNTINKYRLSYVYFRLTPRLSSQRICWFVNKILWQDLRFMF